MTQPRMSKEQRDERLGYWFLKRQHLGDLVSDEGIDDLKAFATSHDAADTEMASLTEKVERQQQALNVALGGLRHGGNLAEVVAKVSAIMNGEAQS